MDNENLLNPVQTCFPGFSMMRSESMQSGILVASDKGAAIREMSRPLGLVQVILPYGCDSGAKEARALSPCFIG